MRNSFITNFVPTDCPFCTQTLDDGNDLILRGDTMTCPDCGALYRMVSDQLIGVFFKANEAASVMPELSRVETRLDDAIELLETVPRFDADEIEKLAGCILDAAIATKLILARNTGKPITWRGHR